MKNVSMDVFEGGVPAAMQYYINETTPNLLIIEGAGDPRQLLAELDSLAEYCDENIKVVVLGHTNDIRLYRELMRRGVSAYLVWPVDPVQMIRAIRERGVMEKCTFCMQRIREGKDAARRDTDPQTGEARPIRDGEIMTACQQTCPAQAIRFGDRARRRALSDVRVHPRP